MVQKIFLMLILCFGGQGAFATDTETLPEGVRTFLVRYLTADTAGAFDQRGDFNRYKHDHKLTLESLEKQFPQAQKLAQEINKIDPQLSESLTFSEMKLKAKAEVQAQAAALGWGITDRLTIAGFIPIIQAQVHVKSSVKESPSVKKASQKLVSYKSKDPKEKARAAILSEILNSLPPVRGEHLQNYLVSDLGYDPVGTWRAHDVGDAELFLKYSLVQEFYYKQAMEFGVIFPTGRVDDPDNLADFEFGYGSWGNYVQSVHDFYIGPWGLNLIGAAGYRHFWPTIKEERLIPSQEFPLTERKEKVLYQKGGETHLTMIMKRDFGSSGFSLDLKYEYKLIAKDDFQGRDKDYDYSILEKYTNQTRQLMGTTLAYSTVDDYKRGDFSVPMRIRLNHERIVSGINTELVNFYQLDCQFFF